MSGSQDQVLQRTVQQIVDAVPSLPTLDDPAPQTVEQLPEIMHFFDTHLPDPEQVIEVPKIILENIPSRPRYDSRFMNRSWRNSWWTCRRSPLLSFLCLVWRTSRWQCRRSCFSLSRSRSLRVQMATVGRRSLDLRGSTGGG